MLISRRNFVAGVAGAATFRPRSGGAAHVPPEAPGERFDPWLEIDGAALAHNADAVSRLAGGRPVLAVIKNNAYGLGLTTVAKLLEPHPSIQGFAVVKADAALALREAGITKPVLLMALFDPEVGAELVARGVQLALCTDDAGERAVQASRRAGKPVEAHIYLDTGMSRMGIPYHRALPVLERLRGLDVAVRGTFMGFTEAEEFDREQLRRFQALAARASAAGVGLGPLHAASSHAVFNFAESHLDLVRPGIALYGGYPSNAEVERSIAELRCAVSLKARVVRVERLRAGDSVSYGRNYVAEGPTWIATLPVGHTDGYPREAVQGARVLVGGNLFPVIGAVSASHTIIEVGEEKQVAIGDVATLMGPDRPEIEPNGLADATGTSVYDVLMHLNPTLPKVV